jgi:hypothetical protein
MNLSDDVVSAKKTTSSPTTSWTGKTPTAGHSMIE